MMKTSDGRFIEKRVKIDKNEIRKLLIKAKIKRKLNWTKLGKVLGVSSHTASYDWIGKGNTIPLSKFKKITLLAGSSYNSYSKKIELVEPFWGQKIKDGMLKSKRVTFPNIKSIEFAEFYGILLGDGCVFSNMNGFSISGDKRLDRDYHYFYINSYKSIS